MSTVAAISTPLGAGGIGIVRVSGRDALAIADAIFNFKTKIDVQKDNLSGVDNSCRVDALNFSAKELPRDDSCSENETIGGEKSAIYDACENKRIKQNWEPLKLNFGSFTAEEFCDKGYAVFFPAEKAFTGEDTVEFYLHGGVRIMQGALERILSEGAVLAEKGEFTKRAYLSGRMTLADAEGVIDMINAESAAGVRAAYRLMDGEISVKIDKTAERLLNLISSMEASLDYPDEMEDEVLPVVQIETEAVLDEIQKLIAGAKKGRMAKHGITAVLAGETNSGKSSLMNALLKSNRAIVTPVAGTTRDTVSESFEYDGVRINLVDTAGIRESNDPIEREGIERAKKAYESADVILHVIDATVSGAEYAEFDNKIVFTILNKCDIASFRCPRRVNTFAVSAKTGENVEYIASALAALYNNGEAYSGEIITSERHLSALKRAERSLKSVIEQKDVTTDLLLIDLRDAYSALGEITGRTATEEIVNAVFSKFCVGK